MALHRNESSALKTFKIIEEETFVKENDTLTRKRVTTYTQLSTEKGATLKSEFIFKGKGKHVKVSPPKGVHTQRSEIRFLVLK